MISIDIEKEPDSNWNKRLLDSDLGTIYQTKEYGSYLQDRLKFKPLYLKFYSNNGEIVSQLLVFQSFKGRGKLAEFFGRGLVYSTIAKASMFLPKYFTWFFGPVVFNLSYQSEISESLGNLLVSQKDKFRGSTHPLNSNFNFPQKFNFQKQDDATFLINLKRDLKLILDDTDKKSVRKNIERSQERGVIVTQIRSDSDLIVYHKILNQHRLENKLIPYSMKDIIVGYKLLKSVGQTGFLAWHNEIPVGGIFISSFNGYINEWGIARSKIDGNAKLYSQDLLRWKIIEWGIQNNCGCYDLSGIRLANRSAKEEGIFRNKAKWGGKLITYHVFSM